MERIAPALRGSAGLPGIAFEDGALIVRALDRMEAGMDFADARHHGRADGRSAFMRFDGKLGRGAAGFSEIAVAKP
jgi:hypothetical protein